MDFSVIDFRGMRNLFVFLRVSSVATLCELNSLMLEVLRESREGNHTLYERFNQLESNKKEEEEYSLRELTFEVIRQSECMAALPEHHADPYRKLEGHFN